MRINRGHSINQHPDGVTIRNLATGLWSKLDYYAFPDGTLGVGGGGQSLAACARRLPILAGLVDERPPRDLVPLEVLWALFAGPDDDLQAPAFPIPSIEMIKEIAVDPSGYPSYSGGCDVTCISVVATALAWRNGSAKAYDLEEDLTAVLGDRGKADTAMCTALARSGNNVTRDGKGPFATWHSKPEWTMPEWLSLARSPRRK